MRIRDWDINLKVRLVGEAFTGIAFWMVFPFLTVYFSSTLGRELTSLLLILSQVIAVFCGLFGGYFADQYGRRRMMLIAIAGETVGYGIFAIASFHVIDSAIIGFIGFTVASLFSNFYQPAVTAMVADVVPERERSYVYSVFYMLMNVSVIVGPLLGAQLFNQYRFYLLVFISITFIVLFVILFIFCHETAPAVINGTREKTSSLKEVFISQMKNYKIIFTDRIFLIYVVSGILVAQAYMQLDMFIPLRIYDTVDTVTLLSIGNFDWIVNSTGLYSILLMINGGLVALFTVQVTKFMMRYSEKTAFVTSSILYAIAILLIGLFAQPWIFIFSMVLFTIGEVATAGIQQNFVAMLAPEDKRGMYFSASGLRFNVGKVVAPLAITLSAIVGAEITGIILTLCCLLAAYLYYIMFKMFEEKRAMEKIS